MIKRITGWISIISFSLVCNISTASFIDASSINAIDISLINTSDIKTDIRKPTEQQNIQINSDHESQQKTEQKIDQETHQKFEETTFNQELQWRILNLLTQQFFDKNHDSISNMFFSNSWLYATNTFSVSISSNDPEFFQVSIIDNQQGEETQLEVPRL